MATAPPEPGGSHGPPPAPAASAGALIGSIALFAALSMVILAALVILGILVDETQDDRRPAGRGGGPTKTVAVEVAEFFVEPDVVEVPAGTHLIVNVTNAGELEHDLNLNGEIGTDRLQPGGSQTADLGVIDATAQAWCTVPGHRDAGMVMTITVTERSPGGG
jgi:nitrite reductase (NO-forming)